MNNIIFNNINGGLVGGVSIKNQIENDREKHMGGSTSIGNESGNNIGLSRFDNLVVPSGLYMASHIGGKGNKKEIDTNNHCVTDELYEKLFGIVRYDMPVLEKNRKTKKNIIANDNKKSKRLR